MRPVRSSVAVTLFLAMLIFPGCGGGGTSSVTSPPPPPPPPPPPTFQNPQVLWIGDAKVNSIPGDHGINDTTFYSPGAVLIPDGSGGGFVAWESDVQGDVFTQRMDASGHPAWSSEISVAPSSPYKAMPSAIGDGAGGVIVAWLDGRAGFCDLSFKGSCDIYAQRFDVNGKILWQLNGVPVVTAPSNHGTTGIAIAPDGSGGAFLAWEDGRRCCTIFAQRIDTAGNPVWAVNGVQVSPNPTLDMGPIGAGPQVIADGAGGAIVSWWNVQVIPLSQPQTVSVQKLDPSGRLVWASSGVTVAMQLMEPDPSGERRYYRMTTDGAGGAVFAANQNIDSATMPSERKVVAQRVTSAGLNVWTNGGVSVSSASTFQAYPAILSAGGGAIIVWRNCTDVGFANCSIAAQRFDAGGQSLWGSQGVPIVSTANNHGPEEILSDGTGGAVIVWNDCRNYPNLNDCYVKMDIYGQRVNMNGQTLWQPDGFPISTAPGNQGVPYTTEFVPTSYAFSSDGNGGFLLAWPDGRHNLCFASNLSSRCELFAQRLKP